MLDWLRKLMAGDQNAAPPGARVERDAQGRITSVQQTLSLAEDNPDAPAHPPLAATDGLTARLNAACDWLANRNIALARERGIGLERDYAYDQENEGNDDLRNLRTMVDRKIEIYQRYWSRDDDFWEPSSVGWPSDHDPAEEQLRFTVPHPAGGALDISIGKSCRQTVYRVEEVDGTLKITDGLIEWGDGFVWPTAPGGQREPETGDCTPVSI